MEQTEASYLSTIKAQDIAIPFAPLDIPSQWTRRLLSAVVIMLVASMVGDLMQNELLSRAKNGNVSKSEAAAEDAREEVIGGLYLLAVAVAGIAFLVWFRRAWRNLKSLGGRDLKYSTAWVVGGFFVPIMNLYRPIQVMREVWHGSNPSNLERDLQPDGPEIRNQLPTPALIAWWWGLLDVSVVLGRTAIRIALGDGNTIDQLHTANTLSILNSMVCIPAVVLAIRIVNRITRWQGERWSLRANLQDEGSVLTSVV